MKTKPKTISTERIHRQHKCEGCDEVFECDACSEAMEESNWSEEDYNCRLYATKHQPSALNRTANPWLCEDCEAK